MIIPTVMMEMLVFIWMVEMVILIMAVILL